MAILCHQGIRDAQGSRQLGQYTPPGSLDAARSLDADAHGADPLFLPADELAAEVLVLQHLRDQNTAHTSAHVDASCIESFCLRSLIDPRETLNFCRPAAASAHANVSLTRYLPPLCHALDEVIDEHQYRQHLRAQSQAGETDTQ